MYGVGMLNNWSFNENCLETLSTQSVHSSSAAGFGLENSVEYISNIVDGRAQ
jgi:hypothetical protein